MQFLRPIVDIYSFSKPAKIFLFISLMLNAMDKVVGSNLVLHLIEKNVFYDNLDGPGHAALIVDFVNRGGKEGGMFQNHVTIEMEKHPRFLSYLLVKNSWGKDNGYYKIEKDFLLSNTYSYNRNMSIVVPITVFEKLFRKMTK